MTDTFIQKTKKLYLDTRSQRNMSKVQEDLADIHRIMTKNVQEIIGRGEKIAGILNQLHLTSPHLTSQKLFSREINLLLDATRRTDALVAESEKYEKFAKALNSHMFLRKYGPVLLVVAIVLLLLWLRYKYF